MKAALACMALLCVSATPSPLVASSVPYAAIVQVECADGTGTAFHIGNGNYITADHVFKAGKCSINGTTVRLIREDGKRDIAQIAGPVAKQSFEVDCTGFHAGTEYMAIGYAGGGIGLTRLPMIYSAFGRDPDNGNGMFIGAEMIPGMSGGPLTNRQFQVAGINVQRWPSRVRSLGDTFVCRS